MPKQQRKQTRKLTDEMIARIERLAATGLQRQEIAHVLGIHPQTLSDWTRKQHGQRDLLNLALHRGENIGLNRRLERIERAGRKGDWRADAWWVERVRRQRWGNLVKVSDPDGKPIQNQVVAPTVVFVLPPKQPHALTEGSNGNGHLPIDVEAETLEGGDSAE